jgi:hypothetical protein
MCEAESPYPSLGDSQRKSSQGEMQLQSAPAGLDGGRRCISLLKVGPSGAVLRAGGVDLN